MVEKWVASRSSVAPISCVDAPHVPKRCLLCGMPPYHVPPSFRCVLYGCTHCLCRRPWRDGGGGGVAAPDYCLFIDAVLGRLYSRRRCAQAASLYYPRPPQTDMRVICPLLVLLFPVVDVQRNLTAGKKPDPHEALLPACPMCTVTAGHTQPVNVTTRS